MVAVWRTDPVCSARLRDASSKTHNLAVIVDAGPKMVTFLVDGHLCDGGP